MRIAGKFSHPGGKSPGRADTISHLGLFHQLEHPRYGKMTAMRRATRVNGERETSSLPPPALGEHTETLLRDLGYSTAEISELRAAGIV